MYRFPICPFPINRFSDKPPFLPAPIALLQETHIVDENLIKLYWKMNFISSYVSTNRGGVITLYDNSFESIESYTDYEGRVAIVVTENEKL